MIHEPKHLFRGTTTNDFDFFVNAYRGIYLKSRMLFTNLATQALAYAIDYSVKDNAQMIIVVLEAPQKYQKRPLPGSIGDASSSRLDYNIITPIDIADPSVHVFREGVNLNEIGAYFDPAVSKERIEEMIIDTRKRLRREKQEVKGSE